MANTSIADKFEVGVVGLDRSGRKLAQAMAAQGIGVVACDPNPLNIEAWINESPWISTHIAPGVAQLIGLLRPFRTVVFSGSDTAHHPFNELLDQLSAGDLVIDAGNCHFKTCSQRAHWLEERNVRYLAVGIIGGGEDDRCGRVFMVGGRHDTCRRVLLLLQAMAVEPTDERCVSHLGPAESGHFVKMIHDAVDYTLMQLIAETSGILKCALNEKGDELGSAAGACQIWARKSRPTADSARWTSETAQELEAFSPTIAAAVGMRAISESERKNDIATALFRQPCVPLRDDARSVLDELDCALRAAVLITYAQGLAVLMAGSKRYGFNIDLAEVIRLWKICGGIHEPMLEEIASAVQATPNLLNLLHDDDLSGQVMERQESLRHAVWRASRLQTPVPALEASLDYLDSYRGVWLPVNLIQARAPSAPPPRPAGLAHR